MQVHLRCIKSTLHINVHVVKGIVDDENQGVKTRSGAAMTGVATSKQHANACPAQHYAGSR
jgi:hypothetical protein